MNTPSLTTPISRITRAHARGCVAILVGLCIFFNGLYPRFIVDLAEYNQIAHFMGSKFVFLNLFAVPSRISVEIMSLLLTGKGHDLSRAGGTRRSGESGKRRTNTSSDFSLITGESRGLNRFLSAVPEACRWVPSAASLVRQVSAGPAYVPLDAPFLVFLFILFFFARPRSAIALPAPISTVKRIILEPNLIGKLGSFIVRNESLWRKS